MCNLKLHALIGLQLIAEASDNSCAGLGLGIVECILQVNFVSLQAAGSHM